MTAKGMGLVEFRTNLDVITGLKNQGYTKKHIHAQLRDKITLSYAQFSRIWNKEFGEKSVAPATKQKPPEVGRSRDIFRKERRVLHNPTMTEERKKEIFG